MKVQLLTSKRNVNIDVLEDTQFVLIPKKQITCTLNMARENVSAELLVPFVFSGKDDVSLTTISNHLAPNTSCNVNVRGVLKESAKFDYVGRIVISKKAQQTVSYLEDDVLNIGENSKNYSQPILEISADDVKASHGATSGRIDLEHIYYLMSRGISEDEAKKIIVEGYLNALLSLIKDDEIKEKVVRMLNA